VLEAENLRQASEEYSGETNGTLTVATTIPRHVILPEVVQAFRAPFHRYG